MNKRQKKVLINFAVVMCITVVFVFFVIGYKDHVNKSAAIKGMSMLGQRILAYRAENNSLPPKSWVDNLIKQMDIARFSDVEYRAIWINMDSGPETILAYISANYDVINEQGAIVLRLNGNVEWIDKEPFESILKAQQGKAEIEMMQKRNQNGLLN